MKELIIVTLLSGLFIGCHPHAESSGGSPIERDGDFNIEVIDSCQYVVYDHGIADQRVYAITHKGNCKYCLERNKQSKQITQSK